MHISIGVGGTICPHFSDKSVADHFHFKTDLDIMLLFVQSKALLVHPRITPYGGFDFTGTS